MKRFALFTALICLGAVFATAGADTHHRTHVVRHKMHVAGHNMRAASHTAGHNMRAAGHRMRSSMHKSAHRARLYARHHRL